MASMPFKEAIRASGPWEPLRQRLRRRRNDDHGAGQLLAPTTPAAAVTLLAFAEALGQL
jgi:hypothetical protein